MAHFAGRTTYSDEWVAFAVSTNIFQKKRMR